MNMKIYPAPFQINILHFSIITFIINLLRIKTVSFF